MKQNQDIFAKMMDHNDSLNLGKSYKFKGFDRMNIDVVKHF